jgi:hypothetical protein
LDDPANGWESAVPLIVRAFAFIAARASLAILDMSGAFLSNQHQSPIHNPAVREREYPRRVKLPWQAGVWVYRAPIRHDLPTNVGHVVRGVFVLD